ncbi:uncharacterized protein LOC135385231 [Ornithodoros turicata]|uniref:uncharacterized protein LOC135385231 n=1 Tax=Ornithodoros turicata TaxID=34597 RepID=UPI0031386950
MAPTLSKQQETRKMRTYTVVKFKNDTVEFVPSSWIIGGKLCLWPGGKPNSRVAQLIRDRCSPEDDWELCACECMASFNSYKKAKKNARDAEYTSHLDTEQSEEEESSAVDPNPAPRKRLRLPSPPCDRDGLTCSPLHETQWPSTSGLVSSQQEARNTNGEPVMPLRPSSVSSNQDTHSQGQYSSPSCSRPATAAHDSEDGVTPYERKSLRLLIEIKRALRDLSQRVAALEGQGGATGQALGDHNGVLEELLKEPLSTVEEWDALEEELQDSATRKAVVSRLAVVGGSNLNDVVRLIMETCTRKSLQQQVTVEGRNGKRAFKGTQLFACVLGKSHFACFCLAFILPIFPN